MVEFFFGGDILLKVLNRVDTIKSDDFLHKSWIFTNIAKCKKKYTLVEETF